MNLGIEVIFNNIAKVNYSFAVEKKIDPAVPGQFLRINRANY